MRSGLPFYCRLVQKAEADLNSNWTEPPAWLERPCWPPKVVAKEEDIQGLPWWVLQVLGVCSQLGQGPRMNNKPMTIV
jgi:hypothetical protein